MASVLSKAFIATAVPDSLCCLEAWHILWGLPRTVSSRFFKGLNMDGLVGVKNPKEMKRAGQAQGDQDEEVIGRATLFVPRCHTTVCCASRPRWTSTAADW